MDKAALTHRRVVAIALPIVISNASIPLLGAVDTGVIGQMGAAAPIGAVGIGAIIIATVYWIFSFLRMGTAGMAAQAFGAGDQQEDDALLARALGLGVAGGLVLVLLQIPIFGLAFRVAPASAEVETLARSYLAIRIWSAPAAIAVFGITGWLIAHERTGAILALQLWMNGLNILLDVVFVLQFGWGVPGVAAATVIAECSGLALGLWLVRGVFGRAHWRNWAVVTNRAVLLRMAVVNGDIFLRSTMLEIVFVSFLFLGAGRGDVTLAANQVLLQFVYIAAYTLDGFAAAAETLVGQALGAKNRARLRRATVLCLQWGFALAALLTGVFAVLGLAFIDLMTTAPDVRAEARIYWIWVIAAPVIAVLSFIMDGVFIGATQTRDMRNMMFVSLLCYGSCLAATLSAFGNHGLWLSFLVFFLARGLTLATRYPELEARADRATS